MTSRKKISVIESEPLPISKDKIKESVTRHLHYTLGKDVYSATKRDWFSAVVYTVRDYRWKSGLLLTGLTTEDAKRVYYLSMEFLIGKRLPTASLTPVWRMC